MLNDEDELTFALKAPVSVKSVGWFNYLAHKNNDDNTFKGEEKRLTKRATAGIKN